MRNLRICGKYFSDTASIFADSSKFCIGDDGIFHVSGEDECLANGDTPENFLPAFGRLMKFKLSTLESQELVVGDYIRDVCHMQFISSVTRLYMGTTRGEFLQYQQDTGGMEEVFQSTSGMITFAVSPDCSFVAIISCTGNLTLFSLTTFEVLLKKELFDPKEVGLDMTPSSICWRHDSRYFVVNTPNDMKGRRLTVYDEQGTLHASTDESFVLHSDILTWMPTGGLIATIEKAKIETDDDLIIFLELNMMRRSTFNPKVDAIVDSGYRSTVKGLCWNPSSEILAVTLQNAVELWHRSNYLWMCKYTIRRQVSSDTDEEIKYTCWDERNVYRLYTIFKSGHYSVHDCQLSFSSGSLSISSLSVSINGCNVYCTPFSVTSAPPPYGYVQLSLQSRVQEVVLSSFWNGFLCVLLNGSILQVHYIENQLKIVKRMVVPKTPEVESAYNWTWPNSRTICSINGREIITYEVPEGCGEKEFLLDSDTATAILLAPKLIVPFACLTTMVVKGPSYVQSDNLLLLSENELSLLDLKNASSSKYHPTTLVTANTPYRDVKYLFTGSFTGDNDIHNSIMLLLHDTRTGLLEVYWRSRMCKVATDCASMTTFHDNLLYTTVQGILQIIHVSELEKGLAVNYTPEQMERYSRKVEKGSMILTCCFNRVNDPTVVVEVLPRGNIETIHPRPLLLMSIKIMLRHEKERLFTKILASMRRHRIDANILVAELKSVAADSNANLSLTEAAQCMSSEVEDPNLLVLFVTEISTENLDFVHLLRGALEMKIQDLTGNKNTSVQPYLATMARLGQYEELLNSKLIFGETNREVAKKRVQFLSFYADKSETLYEAALGTYDLNLVAIVADCLGKDPKEYLPILNNLRTLPLLKRKFQIDVTLKRWTKGLEDLLQDSSVPIEEILKYVQKHQVYADALRILRTVPSTLGERGEEEVMSIRIRIQDVYGEYLESRGENQDASILYMKSGNLAKSVECAVKAGSWEYALVTSQYQGRMDFCRSLLHHFEQKQEWENAARLCEVFLSDYRSAVTYWTKAHHWSHACALTFKDENSKCLIEELVKPKLLEHQVNLADFLTNLLQELKRHGDRYIQIIAKREALLLQSDLGMGDNGEDFSETESVSTMTSGSNPVSSRSRGTSRSGKGRRKQERKVHSLKEGSKYEDKAIIAHVWEAVTNVERQVRADIERTIECMARLELDSEGAHLFDLFADFSKEIGTITLQIWSKISKDEDELLDIKYLTAPDWTTSWKKPACLTHY